MNSDQSDFGKVPADEPALTEKNTETIRGEEQLADEGAGTESNVETSARTRSTVVPSSYGAAGGTTDAYEEGAGESGSHRTGS